ncbi:hypothetical protein D6858_07885 [Tsuneonella suprasediminis]|uniref:Uncharacterized protein n=1 Tax=Tsuneonella suprasediminis TaxID=2306996 RepID=A0A419R1U0_9SPHN|nr:hypothetical protein D6858_07885 [Tsuneonella suprasediminis]
MAITAALSEAVRANLHSVGLSAWYTPSTLQVLESLAIFEGAAIIASAITCASSIVFHCLGWLARARHPFHSAFALSYRLS